MSRKLPGTVYVTADHITRGIRESETRCAIALAIAEHAADPRLEIEVGGGEVWAWVKGTDRGSLATLPEVADRFVHAFDSGEDVQPLEFAVTWRREVTP